jgi:hypothetical protein
MFGGQSLGIAEMKKGFFPYLFNTDSNSGYKGKIPDMKYFGVNEMSIDKKAIGNRFEFLDWYNSQIDILYDFDKELLSSANLIQKNYKSKINFIFKDILKNKLKKKYDGIYSLDVFEHIEKKKEDFFIKNLFKTLNKKGVLILGTPSLESQKYASKYSKIGHVNCKSQGDLKNLLKKYFPNVFAFSMNDEVIHTGYSKMSHYNFMVCCK